MLLMLLRWTRLRRRQRRCVPDERTAAGQQDEGRERHVMRRCNVATTAISMHRRRPTRHRSSKGSGCVMNGAAPRRGRSSSFSAPHHFGDYFGSRLSIRWPPARSRMAPEFRESNKFDPKGKMNQFFGPSLLDSSSDLKVYCSLRLILTMEMGLERSRACNMGPFSS